MSLGITGIKDIEQFKHNKNCYNDENINYINHKINNNDKNVNKNIIINNNNNDNNNQNNNNNSNNTKNNQTNLDHASKTSDHYNRSPNKDLVWVINNSYAMLLRLRKLHEVKNHLQDRYD